MRKENISDKGSGKVKTIVNSLYKLKVSFWGKKLRKRIKVTTVISQQRIIRTQQRSSLKFHLSENISILEKKIFLFKIFYVF